MHELLYPICQAYDSVFLESDIEVGGSDQKFNILVGRDLQAHYGQPEQVGLFMPILTGLDGVQKMSKSLNNYVGITEPPKDMFGKLMSISDEMMPTYFELCTDVPMDEVESICKGLADNTLHPMDIKKRLGREIVAIYHSIEAANEAQAEFERVFSHHEIPEDMPELKLSAEDIKDGKVWIIKLLTLAGMTPSNSEARRLVQQGGVTIDGEKISDPSTNIEVKDGQVIKSGKLKFARIRL
jgi:tyrosyl-tRNA synthetase